MDEVRQLLNKANQYFQTADHLCHVTYPLVNDPKLLMIITENLFKAIEHGLSALLYNESMYNRITSYPEDFTGKLDVFRLNCAERYGFSSESSVLIREVRDLVLDRKEAPVEFSRRDKFIIASENYKLKALGLSTVKRYITQTKTFMERLNEVFNNNER
jgi:hypothetical protein